jgi:DNA helicase-2/ATP-dependent DNA helicase PcrA
MTISQRPDLKEETNRLNDTMEFIENAISATEENRNIHRAEIKDAFVNLDYLDSSQSYISILVNAKLLEELEKNYDNLIRYRQKPYFARIDFKQEGNVKIDRLYIGKMTLYKPEWEVPMIIDWRSPVASIYYDGRLGEVSYETQMDSIKGELYLKRQYTINNGQLEDFMDIDITANDTFLQASLEANADNRLKDIVSTIQAEQNAIIRADIGKPLVVQGVAGSGKTTIALHRIAYLIYTYSESFYPDNFMIIAPNKLFLNYISAVLPELGVDKVKQTTFIDFIFELIGTKYKLIDSNEKLISIINDSNQTSEAIKKISAFKGSFIFKNIIDNYIKKLEYNFVPDVDFELGGLTLATAKEIKKSFIKEYQSLPLYQRIIEVKKSLRNRLKMNKNNLLSQIEHKYDTQIEGIRITEAESEERRLKIVHLINERDQALNDLKKSASSLIAKYIGKFPKVDLFSYYKEIITDEETLQECSLGKISSDFIKSICKYSMDILDTQHVELEDLAPLAYLKHRIFGFDKKLDIKYVVIDEAQDFSHFQFYALKKILNTELFTILGDLSQGIHSYRAIKNWDFVLNKIFDQSKSQYLTLEQSYRTTVEIMNMANKVIEMCPIEGLILAKPVVRHGENPSILKFNSTDEIITAVESKINELKQEGFHSIALICKTLRECNSIHKTISKKMGANVKLLDEKESIYNDHVVVLPSYLAKGLEFDAVIIINIDDTYTEDELDLKLLYVAMTRALHKMCIYYKASTIPIFDKIINS